MGFNLDGEHAAIRHSIAGIRGKSPKYLLQLSMVSLHPAHPFHRSCSLQLIFQALLLGTIAQPNQVVVRKAVGAKSAVSQVLLSILPFEPEFGAPALYLTELPPISLRIFINEAKQRGSN